jgi:hypothetical protein
MRLSRAVARVLLALIIQLTLTEAAHISDAAVQQTTAQCMLNPALAPGLL